MIINETFASTSDAAARIDALLIQSDHLRFSDYHTSHRLATQALALATQTGDRRSMCLAYDLLCWAEGWMATYASALEHAFAGMKLARQIHDTRLEGRLIMALGYLMGTRGNYHDGMSLYDRAQEIAEQIGDTDLLAWCYLGRSTLMGRLGDYEAGFQWLERVKTLQTRLLELPFAYGVVALFSWIICLQMPQSDLKQSESHVREMLRLGREVGSPVWTARGLAALADLRARAGFMQEAEAMLAAANEVGQHLGDNRVEFELLEARANIDVAAGRIDAGIATLRRLCDRARELGLGVRETALTRRLIVLSEQVNDRNGRVDAYQRMVGILEILHKQQLISDRRIVQAVYDMHHAQREADLRAEALKAHHEQEVLTQKLLQERELADLRQRMLTRISHEFRTPLAIIKSSAAILSEYFGRLSDDQRYEHLSRINRRVDWLTRLLDDAALTLESSDASQRPLAEMTDTDPLLQATLLSLEVYNVDAGRVRLEREGLESRLPVHGDTLRMILTHLLVNALRFSKGEVRLTVVQQPGALMLTISDNGIGIPPAELEAVREPLIRGSNSGEIPGLGMGLALVQQAVTHWKGSMQIDSALGQGTTVSVCLPLAN